MKTYSELIAIPTYIERYRYLRIGGRVGHQTFGIYRRLNQVFYRSREWLQFRNRIIVRDMGCDLAFQGLDIHGAIAIHHLNPVSVDDIVEHRPCLLDPENVICCTFNTHQAIHYGDESLLPIDLFVERSPNDTCPWKI